jgi:putative copper export protein
MDPTFWLNFFMRWLHVVSAVAVVGGLLAMRFAVVPGLAGRADAAELYAAIQRSFKKLLHSALGLALLTGFYNYGVVSVGALRKIKETHSDLGLLGSYHAVMGVKMLLTFALFGMAIALLKPADTLPEAKKGPLTVNLVVGLVIIALAAYLRRLWPLPLP